MVLREMISEKTKRILKSVRVIILLAFIIFALLLINPKLDRDGVAIRSVTSNSSASLAGIENPGKQVTPVHREVITSLNSQDIRSESEYYAAIADLQVNDTVTIITTENSYILSVLPETETVILNETEFKNFTKTIYENETINGTVHLVNKTINETREVNKTYQRVIGVADLGLDVYPAPKTNVRKGLDLQGGTRVLLAPERKLTTDELDLLLENLRQRLNVFGITDVIIKEASDLSGNQYISVEIAGVNEEEIRSLLAKQGKFEAKIGEDVVFVGGNKDITYVCRTAECSGIDPNAGCGPTGDGQWACRFRFSISLSVDAAQRQADLTRNLQVVTDGTNIENRYLEKSLDLFLDDGLVSSLQIGEGLRGLATTEISISGSGVGTSSQDARTNALAEMKSLQTVLITGSLPVQLNIVKSDTSSPLLGEEFTKSALLIGLFAILAVALVVFIRYRSVKVSLAMVGTMISEVILLMGLAALLRWNIDLAAVAGIIVAVGTGVDDQIVITDETLRGEGGGNWKERIKRAFFIIFAAFFTTIAAMLPLLVAGAGLVKGFALTTIFGVVIGVLITRPAFAALIEILLE